MANIFRIGIIGNCSVGKSAIVDRLCNNKYSEIDYATIGISIHCKIIKINEIDYKCYIMDTAGLDMYRSINMMYYKNYNGIVLCYDITDRQSFNDLNKWLNDVKENVNLDNIAVIIVGSKNDKYEDRKIEREEGFNFAKTYGFLFAEVSAKNNIDINFIFTELVNDMHKKHILRNNNNNKTCCSFL
jgi:small GTP-binding protein